MFTDRNEHIKRLATDARMAELDTVLIQSHHGNRPLTIIRLCQAHSSCLGVHRWSGLEAVELARPHWLHHADIVWTVDINTTIRIRIQWHLPNGYHGQPWGDRNWYKRNTHLDCK